MPGGKMERRMKKEVDVGEYGRAVLIPTSKAAGGQDLDWNAA